MGKLEGRVALITGAANGMGAADARLLAAEGAKVLVGDISERGADIAAEIGDAALYFPLDVTSEESWKEAIEICERTFGPVGILVNNAGMWTAQPLVDITTEVFHRIVALNQHAVLLGMRLIVDSMKRAGNGSIVNISSTAALKGVPHALLYAMTKWAVRGMTLSAVNELASYGIRINVIYPGPIANTAMTDANDPDYIEQLRRAIPMNHLGDPMDVAQAVLFLASDEARFITGAQLTVDGGIAAGSPGSQP